MGRCSPFPSRKSKKQEKQVEYQSTELNEVDLTSSETLLVTDDEGVMERRIIIVIQ